MHTSTNPTDDEVPKNPPVDRLTATVRSAAFRMAMPILSYPGAGLIGANVRTLVTDAQAQVDAQLALHERYRTRVVMSAMDLSVEAEVFGAAVQFSQDELPVVTEGRIGDRSDVDTLVTPFPGEGRTAVALETVRQLSKTSGAPLVLGGCIGPFSLAARLLGLSEALGLTITDPGIVHQVLERTTSFLRAYVDAFRQAGAEGVIMAEPSAGLLSPKAMATFSSGYIRRVVESLEPQPFSLVVHNCAARLIHLESVLEAGARCYHFGAPMDLAGALARVDVGILMCGNLDPAAVFCQASPEVVRDRTRALLAVTAPYRNFVISSGCDIPPATSMENVDAFFEETASALVLGDKVLSGR
jgi:uroporphyrinogen decarboxylase